VEVEGRGFKGKAERLKVKRIINKLKN